MDMQQTSNEELLQDNQHSEEEQVEEKQEVVVKEEDYKNLQSTYTKANQERIELAKKLVEKDKSEILNISDTKLQNKVIKELYGYESLSELKAIHGDRFFDNNSDDNSEDDLITLQQKVRLMEYRAERNQVEESIKSYVLANKIADEEVVEKIKEELKFISTELDVNERVKRAAKIVVGNNSNAYLDMQDKVIKTSNKVGGQTINNEVTKEFSSILRKYL